MAVDKQLSCMLMLLALDWRQLTVSAAVEFSRLHPRSIRRVLPPSQQDAYEGDACLHSFQISENTIIRTQDSRTLGAKYLNETELPTKEACVQWCCDTSECNVAVYEGKNKGSCYIFDCSPTGDFKCKFTSHNHYSIAVLKIARHSYDLGKWGSESKHEEELKYLRMTSLTNTMPTSPLTTASTSTTSTTMATEAPMAPVAASVPSTPAKVLNANVQPPTEKEHRCSRFQFECRNTSECIAIYNACDGIPQCSDGSDESDELECPTGNLRKIKPAPNGIGSSHNLKPADISDHSDSEGPYINSQPALETEGQLAPPGNLPYLGQPRANFVHQQQLQEQHQQKQLPSNQYYKTKPPRPDAHPAGSIFNHKGNGLLQNQPYDTQNGVSYHRPPSPHAAYNDQYEPPSQDDDGGTSYSHPQQQQQQQQQHPLAAPHNYPNPDYEGGNDYWQPETARQKQPESFSSFDHSRIPGSPHKSAHEESMSQSYSHGQPQNHGHIPVNHGLPESSPPDHYDDRNTFPARKGYNYHENYQMDPLNLPQTKDEEHGYPDNLGQSTGSGHIIPGVPYRMDAKAAKKTIPAEKPLYTESKAGLLSDDKSNPNSLEAKEPQLANLPNEVGIDGDLPYALETTVKLDIIPTEVPTTAAVKMTEASIHSHAQLHKVEVNYAQVAVQDIDESNESSGAVLALTLGLSITGLLLVLVGCRLRVVRRHLRRGRSPYAHDADYLVNGMYL